MRSLIKSSSFSEADLASAFLRASSSLNFGRHSYNFVDELETLAGIPDAVGINSSDLNQLQSFRARYKKFDFTNGHAKILARLKTTRVISETTTLALTGMNPDYFYKHLASLEREGIVERNQRGSLRLASDFELPEIEMLSIEFKLNAWKSALRQAMRYKTFSSMVCVIMPPNKEAVLQKNKQVFKRMRVGVGVFNSDEGTIKYIVKPARTAASARQFYIDTLGRLPVGKF